MTAALAVRHLSVHYGEIRALQDCSLTLEPGTVTGLIGMNGSGKTTLFSAIMGAVRPSGGTVEVLGADAAAARKRGLLGYVPQSEAVDWAFPVSVGDVVMMGRYGHLRVPRRARSADRAAVADALARVGLTDVAERQIGQLSGGQRKRAFVARALAQDAQVLLLDEPFAGVDAASEATMVTVVRDLAAHGRTVLVSTHDLKGLPALADQAALLLRRVLFHGAVRDALEPHRLAQAMGLSMEQGEDA